MYLSVLIKIAAILKKITYQPTPFLQEYIEEYCVVEYDSLGKEAIRVADFPRTAMDMVFCFTGQVYINLNKERNLKVAGASFFGNFDKPYEISFSPQLSILHVRFKANGIYPLTKTPLELVVNGYLPIQDLINHRAGEVFHQMQAVQDFALRIKILEVFLTKIYTRSTINYRLNHAIKLIQKEKGLITIKHLSEQLNTNYKSLERWFRSKVGPSPKKFASITRFKNIIEKIDRDVAPSWMDYVVEYGFHDQSHFIKSFENFSGLSPEEYWTSNQMSKLYNDSIA